MRRALLYILLLTSFLAGACQASSPVVINAPDVDFETSEVWTLVAVRGKEISRGEEASPITIQVNPEAGTFVGSSGCNRYSGNFANLGEGRMRLSDISATRIACPEHVMRDEATYLQLLRRCDHYSLDHYTLVLLQGDKPLLSFEKM